MRYFAVKTSNAEFVEQFESGDNTLLIDGVNSYDDAVVPGLLVFLVFGGDGVPWQLGTVAVCQTLSGPLERGYDREKQRNYKLRLEVIARFPRTLAKSDFKYYEGTYDSFVGVRTKGERNQALLEIGEATAIAILRAILDYFPELEENIAGLITPDIMELIQTDLRVLVPQILAYGQSPERIYEADEEGAGGNDNLQGENLLLYGVPGCGKSYTIADQYCNDDRYMERVVFHPDFTYSDFIGQILPKINRENGDLEYSFTAGPFTRILKKAYNGNLR